MEVLVLLIPLSVLLVCLAAWVFWWSAHSGQFDDLDGPAYRLLADDDSPISAVAPNAPGLTPIKLDTSGPDYGGVVAAASNPPPLPRPPSYHWSDQHGA